MSKRILLPLLAASVVLFLLLSYLRKDDAASVTVSRSRDLADTTFRKEKEKVSYAELPVEEVRLPEAVRPPETTLGKKILAQAVIVEERREALRVLVRGERLSAGAELGPDWPEYQAAKRAFNAERKRLEELRRAR